MLEILEKLLHFWRFEKVIHAFLRNIYFFNMLSYVLVGLLGTNAVFAAAAFYVIIFFAASVLFLSRKA